MRWGVTKEELEGFWSTERSVISRHMSGYYLSNGAVAFYINIQLVFFFSQSGHMQVTLQRLNQLRTGENVHEASLLDLI